MKSTKKTKSIKAQLKKSAINAKGAFKTEYDRQNIISRFAAYLKNNNIQITTIEQIKTKYIVSYVNSRKTQGIQLRSLQKSKPPVKRVVCSSPIRACYRHAPK